MEACRIKLTKLRCDLFERILVKAGARRINLIHGIGGLLLLILMNEWMGGWMGL